MSRKLFQLPLVALALAVCALGARAQETSLQRAVRLAGEGDLSAALDAARAGSSPLARAQGELYVLHHAGALEAALQAGLAGLEESPSDAWLLERSAYIALTLGAGALAIELCDELQAVLPPEEWGRHEWMQGEALALQATREEEAASLRRAKQVSVTTALLALALVTSLSLRRRSAPRSA